MAKTQPILYLILMTTFFLSSSTPSVSGYRFNQDGRFKSRPYCGFSGGEISVLDSASSASSCGLACFEESRCTHFTYAFDYEGGSEGSTCTLHGEGVQGRSEYRRGSECGYVTYIARRRDLVAELTSVPAPMAHEGEGDSMGRWQYCPPGSYVDGLDLRTITDTNNMTLVTGVEAHCGKPDLSVNAFLYSAKSGRGRYQGDKLCLGYTTGFQLKKFYERVQDLRLHCATSFAPNVYIDGVGEEKEEGWLDQMTCPPLTALCGMRTQLVDDTITSLDAACCTVKAPDRSCTLRPKWDNIATCYHGQRCQYSTTSSLELPFPPAVDIADLPPNWKEYLMLVNLGFPPEASKEGIVENYRDRFGDKEVSQGRSISDVMASMESSQGEQRELTGEIECANGYVQQLLLGCGVFRIRTGEMKCSNAQNYESPPDGRYQESRAPAVAYTKLDDRLNVQPVGYNFNFGGYRKQKKEEPYNHHDQHRRYSLG